MRETDDYLKNDRFSLPYKKKTNSKIWWIRDLDRIGLFFFTFDKEKIYEFYHDYPEKLTSEEKKIFDKENPTLARLKDPSVKGR